MSLTTDKDDPRLQQTRGDGQQEAYLVLSKEERDKGFARPVRMSYTHVGLPKPKYPLRPLTKEEQERHAGWNYVAYEQYPEEDGPAMGRFWTQDQLDSKGCGFSTTMAVALAETYARDPSFYGATWCATCGCHLRVGAFGEFVWTGTTERVGT